MTPADPTSDELAAIIAAVEAVWPRAGGAERAAPEPSRWRFSGRWWAKPVLARRERP